jgi:hypothetical protein
MFITETRRITEGEREERRKKKRRQVKIEIRA